jgi:hypothetical protein
MSRMIRSSLFAMFAAAVSVPPAVAAESTTIRIEPRPYYGATVTIEHGVRVYRPLPTVKQVIINPNQTPLSLSYAEVTEHRQSHNYYYDRSGYPMAGYAGGIGFPPGFHAKPMKNKTVGGFRP